MRTMNTLVYPSPIGPLTLVGGDAVLELRFPGRGRPSAENGALTPALGAARTQLEAYFAGGLREFDLELELIGTPFYRSVWAALQRIPYGTTTSYGELARKLSTELERDEPFVPRAVASAVAHTPVPIVVPCHRVIGADGSLTGYGGGLHRKRALLDFEASGGDLAVLEASFTRRQLTLL
jgi:methylated-DNA-[protein]-cysteine S-methyltransferase